MHAHRHNPDTKPRDLRRSMPTGRPYCPICGARSGQSHDAQAHAERAAAETTQKPEPIR
jgi:hypothetical protein